MRILVKLLGVSSCCLVMALSGAMSPANADALRLTDTDMDRVTAGNLTPPPPLITLPPAFSGAFDINVGLLNPPPPPPPPDPPAPPPPVIPGVDGVPGQILQAILQLILSGGLR